MIALLHALGTQPGDTVSRLGRQLVNRIPLVWRERLCYWLVHLHGRYANALTLRMLPNDRWPAFWYHSKRLGKSYSPGRYAGRTTAVFTREANGYAAWQALLGPDAEVLFLNGEHSGEAGLFSDAGLSLWVDALCLRLDASEHGENAPTRSGAH